MRVVIAPDSFKGSISADDAARAIADGWHHERPGDHLHLLPVADGGEGTLEAIATAVPAARRVPVTVTGPSGVAVGAHWLLLPPTAAAPGGTAAVELANTSGIELLGSPPRLRPLDAHTRGFGEAIAAALAYGVGRLMLGIGSSASTDGGTGLLCTLGARFVDRAGHPIADGARGLADLATADLSGLPALPPGGVTVLTDVTNPLLGRDGAAAVFGPQKGARPDDVRTMEAGLRRLAAALPGIDPDRPGAGAAGGVGYALAAWGARLVPGAEAVADLIGLPSAISDASFVITGEGSFDSQSAGGKAPTHVAAIARARGVPSALVAGRITGGARASDLFQASVSLTDLAGSTEAAIADPRRWLRDAGARLAQAVGA